MASEVNGIGQRVQAVDRAVELLQAVARAPQPEVVATLAERCGLHRSTAWRLLATLEHHGLVDRDPATGRYSVGHAAVQLAAAAGHDGLVRRAHPLLGRLAEEAQETASLAVPRQLQLVYVDQVQAPHVMAANWLGRPTPLHATSTGKAFLAWLGEERLGELPDPLERFTDTTITGRGALRAELAEIRERGYAVSRGELEEALWGVSAAVRDAGGHPVAVVSLWGVDARIRARGLDVLGRLTAGTAGELAALLA